MAPVRKPRATQRPVPLRTGSALPAGPSGESIQNIDAEISVLGAMILNNEVIDAVIPLLNAEHFVSAAHRKIYEAVMALHAENQAVDLVTLPDELKRRGALDPVGGVAYISTLIDRVPAAANAEHYAGIVREKAITRDLLAAAREIFDSASRGDVQSRELLDEAQSRIFHIAESGMSGSVTPMKDALKAAFEMIDKGREGMLTGLATGFTALDELTSGFQKGELIILAGRPSMGKTSLALNILEHVGVHQHRPAVIFSLEMGRVQIARNMLCAHARLDSHRVRRGRLSDSEREKLGQHVGDLYDAPIFIDDSSALNCFELRAKARRLKARHGLDILVIDYIQLLDAPQAESRVQEISRISRALKGLAREISIPVVALAQLNRQVEVRDDHRPRMADLRESGSLEQDADVVLLLHRPAYYNQNPDDLSAELIVAKQRNGPTGKVPLTFLKKHMRFESSAENFGNID